MDSKTLFEKLAGRTNNTPAPVILSEKLKPTYVGAACDTRACEITTYTIPCPEGAKISNGKERVEHIQTCKECQQTLKKLHSYAVPPQKKKREVQR